MSEFVKDPANPTNAELAAAIDRGLADGSLIDAETWLARTMTDELRAWGWNNALLVVTAADDGAIARAVFERACRIAAGDPDHQPMVDLTLPARRSPDAAERASWRSESVDRTALAG